MPLAVCNLDGTEGLICDPSKVKAVSREYWSKLYHHNPAPAIPKPWLNSPSVLEICTCIQADPFLWPRPASFANFRPMLRKGNAQPSPEPDEWEKWLVKSLSDKTLLLVLELHNHIVLKAHFPGALKDIWLTMFHKRGLCTELLNWHGLLLSNYLASSPMIWLNYCLTPYSAKLGIIPENQVATQQGVQTRDLMSFLGGAKSWAKQKKTMVYALKCDQMKGFNYLAPKGL